MRRRLLRFLVVAVLAVVVAALAVDLWARRQVSSEFARLEQKYGPLDARALVAAKVPADENRARYVGAAAALVVRGPLLKGYGILHTSLANFEKAPQAPVPADIQEFIDLNTEAMRVADGARRLHRSSWEADYAGGSKVPPWLSVRDLSNVLSFAARLDIKAGRADDASQRIAAGLAVSASLTDEPSLIAQLIRVAVATQHAEVVERLITEAAPTEAALAEIAALLTENRKTDPMRVGLLAELRSTNAILSKGSRGEGVPGMDLPVASNRLMPPLIRLTRVQYLRDMERLIDSQATPPPRPALDFSSRWRFIDPLGLSASGARGLLRAIETGDTFNSVFDVTAIGVALRRHRLEKGSYPGDLSALVPAYLPGLPGKLPAYVRNRTGFTLKGEVVRTSAPTPPAIEWAVPR